MEETQKTQIITRKYNIVPCKSYSKEWRKKCFEYTLSDLNGKLESTEYVLKYKEKDKEKITALKLKIEQYKQDITNMVHSGVKQYEFTNRMVEDYTKNLIRESMESEARRKNYILSYAFSTMIGNGLQYEKDYKVRNKFISEMLLPAYRIKGSSKGSLFDETEIANTLKGYGNAFSQELSRKIKTAVKDGLLEGKVSLPTYKMDSPLTIAKSTMGFSHDYSSYDEMVEHIGDKGFKLYFDFGGYNRNTETVTPSIARFTFNLGSAKNRKELFTYLLRVYSGEYDYCGSSIQFDKKGKKIMLNLSMEIPVKDNKLFEENEVDVDLGVEIPAICTLNHGDIVLDIGTKEELLRMRTKIQSQRRNLQKSLVIAKGGHGRNKKLRKLETLKKRDADFANTYLHMVSKNVVDFAVDNKAKYINLKNISEYDTKDYLLKNMSYYKLCQQIEYKAAIQGIIVRNV
jgi:hypothetical protein